MKRFFLLSLFLPVTIYGQLNNSYHSPSFVNHVSNAVEFTPPEAASLMKYVDYPVSHLTGIPDIKIPLHTIKVGNLTFPLELSFHIDNYAKVKQLPGPAGSGWSLSSEIQITREIRGFDDFLYGNKTGYYSINNGNDKYAPFNYQDGNYSLADYQIGKIYKGEKDLEPDKFYYRLLGKTGSFYLQHQSDGKMKAVSVPYDNGVSITCDVISLSDGQGPANVKFTIIDTDGTKYEFGSACDYNRFIISGDYRKPISWKCSKIYNTRGDTEFEFSYDVKQSYKVSTNYLDRIEIYDDFAFVGGQSSIWSMKYAKELSQPPLGTSIKNHPFWQIAGIKGEIFAGDEADRMFWGPGNTFIFCSSQGVGNPTDQIHGKTPSKTMNEQWSSLVKKISFRGGEIEFFYTNNGYGNDFHDDHQLDCMKIYNSSGEAIKTVKLTQSGSNYSRILGKVQVDDMLYTLSYPSSITRSGDNSKTTDFWGYKTKEKGRISNPNIPRQSISIKRREVTKYFLTESSLDPSQPDPVTTFIGSYDASETLRIDSSKYHIMKMTYPTGGTVEFVVEQNRYKDSAQTEKGVGGYRIAEIIYSDNGEVKKKKRFEYTGGVMRKSPDYSSTTDGFRSGYTEQGVEFIYDVQESSSASSSTINGLVAAKGRKRTYLQGSIGRMNFESGSLVYYPTITEYEIAGSEELGKTVYNYAVGGGALRTGTPQAPYPLEPDEWSFTYLKAVHKYKKVGNDFVYVYRKDMQYNIYTDPVKIFRMRLWESTIKDLVHTPAAGVDIGTWRIQNSSLSDMTTETRGITTGCLQLVKEKVSVWDDEWRVKVDSTLYFYENPQKGVVSKIVRYRSDGQQEIEQILYPNDYVSSSAVISLIGKNIIDRPMERVVRSNGKMVAGEVFLYDTYGNPNKIFRLNTDNLTEAQFKMSNKGSAGNFDGTPQTTFTMSSWYKHEADLTYDIYNNPRNITRMRSKPYMTTYIWGYKGLYPVAEVKNAAPADLATYNAAVTIDLLNRVASANTPATADMTAINALRSNNNIQVSTYTYKPGVGMLTATDPNGIVTNYSYDTYNRLKEIYYMEAGVKKVLESYDYHYKVKP